jgi:hypothetical protein
MLATCKKCGLDFEKSKEKEHMLFDCKESKKYKCACGAILNRNESDISTHNQICAVVNAIAPPASPEDNVITFRSVEEIEAKLTQLKLIDFADGYTLRKECESQTL